jgi:DNA polymerase-3 subunit delta'
VGTHRQKLRVILIHPAEALNRQAANALLKSLEEPPPGTLFLLVSHEPMRLLPTLRSRCQSLAVPLSSAAAGEKYLADAGVRDAATWLALAGGAPALAEKLAGKTADWLEPFLDTLQAGPSLEVIATAASLEKNLKAAKGENPLPQLIDWAQKWVVDLNLAAERQPVRFYFAQRARITILAETLAEKHRIIELTRFYRHLLRLRRESAHPLNARLFLEQFLFCYRALFVE